MKKDKKKFRDIEEKTKQIIDKTNKYVDEQYDIIDGILQPMYKAMKDKIIKSYPEAIVKFKTHDFHIEVYNINNDRVWHEVEDKMYNIVSGVSSGEYGFHFLIFVHNREQTEKYYSDVYSLKQKLEKKHGKINKDEYRIFFNEDGKWWCGLGVRSNSQFALTDDKSEADILDDEYAVLTVKEFINLNYDCKVVPEVSIGRKLEILESN